MPSPPPASPLDNDVGAQGRAVADQDCVARLCAAGRGDHLHPDGERWPCPCPPRRQQRQGPLRRSGLACRLWGCCTRCKASLPGPPNAQADTTGNDAEGVRLTDTLPAGLTLVSAPSECTTANPIVCTIPGACSHLPGGWLLMLWSLLPSTPQLLPFALTLPSATTVTPHPTPGLLVGGEPYALEITAIAATAGTYVNTAILTADNQAAPVTETATVTATVRAGGDRVGWTAPARPGLHIPASTCCSAPGAPTWCPPHRSACRCPPPPPSAWSRPPTLW